MYAYVWMDMCVHVSTCVHVCVQACAGMYIVYRVVCVRAHTCFNMIENILTNC